MQFAGFATPQTKTHMEGATPFPHLLQIILITQRKNQDANPIAVHILEPPYFNAGLRK